MLSSTLASNKLAVCLGDGSLYDKHYDNSGPEDLRKLTVLLYLNPHWRPELGGYFRLYLPEHCIDRDPTKRTVDSDGFHYKDIAPINDRLLVFWSDRIVHSVQPSEVDDVLANFCAYHFSERKLTFSITLQVFHGDSDHRHATTVWIAAEDSIAIVQHDSEVQKHCTR